MTGGSDDGAPPAGDRTRPGVPSEDLTGGPDDGAPPAGESGNRKPPPGVGEMGSGSNRGKNRGKRGRPNEKSRHDSLSWRDLRKLGN